MASPSLAEARRRMSFSLTRHRPYSSTTNELQSAFGNVGGFIYLNFSGKSFAYIQINAVLYRIALSDRRAKSSILVSENFSTFIRPGVLSSIGKTSDTLPGSGLTGDAKVLKHYEILTVVFLAGIMQCQNSESDPLQQNVPISCQKTASHQLFPHNSS